MSPHLPSLALSHHDLTLSECDVLIRIGFAREATFSPASGRFLIRGETQGLNSRIVTRLVRLLLVTIAGGIGGKPMTIRITPEGETFARAIAALAVAA